MNILDNETLIHVVSKMLNKDIVKTEFKSTKLQGGTLGDVNLITGTAEDKSSEMLPFKLVWKIQRKWMRPGDSGSWRREYDLYQSDFNKVFTGSFRWPECYHSELHDEEIQLWMEHIDGVSGCDLSTEALVTAAEELGSFQGRLFKTPELLGPLAFLGDAGFIEREYLQWHRQPYSYEFLVSDECKIPGFLKQMLLEKRIEYNAKTLEYNYLRSTECKIPAHLKQMLIDVDDNIKTIFESMKTLPVVLCHRDFWIENIFHSDGKTVLIDWDSTGWGYVGEDIASLIIDDTDVNCIEEYCQRIIPAYFKGISKYIDIADIDWLTIKKMIIIKFGYRILQGFMFSQSLEVRNEKIAALQKIYEMKSR